MLIRTQIKIYEVQILVFTFACVDLRDLAFDFLVRNKNVTEGFFCQEILSLKDINYMHLIEVITAMIIRVRITFTLMRQ